MAPPPERGGGAFWLLTTPEGRLLTCRWNHHSRISSWHLCSQGKAVLVCGEHPPAQTTRPGPGAWVGPPGQTRCPGRKPSLGQQLRRKLANKARHYLCLPTWHGLGCVSLALVLPPIICSYQTLSTGYQKHCLPIQKTKGKQINTFSTLHLRQYYATQGPARILVSTIPPNKLKDVKRCPQYENKIVRE